MPLKSQKSGRSSNSPFVKKMTIYQKQRTVLTAIRKSVISVQEDKDIDNAYFDKSLLELDVNTDDFVDETGKTIRWRRTLDPQEPKHYSSICNNKGERKLSDIEAEAYFTQFSEDLYERLEARRRAVSNWKRLKIVIVILKMCNGRLEEKKVEKEE